MESELNRWNKQQKKLRAHLADPASHLEAVDLFLKQHAAVHSAEMSSIDVISFEDEIISGKFQLKWSIQLLGSSGTLPGLKTSR